MIEDAPQTCLKHVVETTESRSMGAVLTKRAAQNVLDVVEVSFKDVHVSQEDDQTCDHQHREKMWYIKQYHEVEVDEGHRATQKLGVKKGVDIARFLTETPSSAVSRELYRAFGSL